MSNRVSEPISLTPKARETIAALWPNDTVLISEVPVLDGIFVEPADPEYDGINKRGAAINNDNGGSIGISRDTIERLKDHADQ